MQVQTDITVGHSLSSLTMGGEPEGVWHWGIPLVFPSLTKGFGVAYGLQEKEWSLIFEEEKEKMVGHSYAIFYCL